LSYSSGVRPPFGGTKNACKFIRVKYYQAKEDDWKNEPTKHQAPKSDPPEIRPDIFSVGCEDYGYESKYFTVYMVEPDSRAGGWMDSMSLDDHQVATLTHISSFLAPGGRIVTDKTYIEASS